MVEIKRNNRFWVRMKLFMRNRNVATFCLFLLFATILWFGHALNTVRERQVRIDIQYLGIPEDVAFTQPLPQYFEINVRDQGKRLRGYSAGSFSAIQIDLASQLTNKSGTVIITAEQIRPKITDQLQGTAKLQRVQPEAISTEYYKQQKKMVKVQNNCTIVPAANYILSTDATVTPQTIAIFGRQEQLDTISTVQTEEQTFSNIKDSLSSVVKLIPIEGIRFAQEQVSIEAITEQLTEKVFDLPVLAKGLPHGYRMRTFPATVHVTLQVSLAHFGEIDFNTIEAVCDYKEGKQSLPVSIKYNSPYIKKVRLTPEEVEYIIEQ